MDNQIAVVTGAGNGLGEGIAQIRATTIWPAAKMALVVQPKRMVPIRFEKLLHKINMIVV